MRSTTTGRFARGHATSQGDDPIRCLTATVATLTILILARPAWSGPLPPPGFVDDALCVHSGWHYTHHRVRGVKPEYVLWGHGHWRTWDVPDTVYGGTGEGGWTATSDPRYGGGMSFTLGTWNRAGAPYARSSSDIAAAQPAEQIRRAYVVVLGESSPWSEWPNTSRACGLR